MVVETKKNRKSARRIKKILRKNGFCKKKKVNEETILDSWIWPGE